MNKYFIGIYCRILPVPLFPPEEQRKFAILFSATILAARKLNELGDRPVPSAGSVYFKRHQ